MHLVRLTYVSRVNSTTVRLSNEHTEYKWVGLDVMVKIKDLDVYLKKLLKDKSIMSFIKDYIDRQ